MQRLIRRCYSLFVIVLIALGSLVVLRSELMFDGGLDYYGPLSSNLLIVLGYIIAMQCLMLLWFHLRGGFHEIVLMGLVVVFAALGMAFYSNVNQIPLNPIIWFSGIAFGVIQTAFGIFNVVQAKRSEIH